MLVNRIHVCPIRACVVRTETRARKSAEGRTHPPLVSRDDAGGGCESTTVRTHLAGSSRRRRRHPCRHLAPRLLVRVRPLGGRAAWPGRSVCPPHGSICPPWLRRVSRDLPLFTFFLGHAIAAAAGDDEGGRVAGNGHVEAIKVLVQLGLAQVPLTSTHRRVHTAGGERGQLLPVEDSHHALHGGQRTAGRCG